MTTYLNKLKREHDFLYERAGHLHSLVSPPKQEPRRALQRRIGHMVSRYNEKVKILHGVVRLLESI